MILKKGFTLIELLVVMAVIALVMGVSLFGLSNTRTEARNNTRKANLETIRSALEIYKADCGDYPATAAMPAAGGTLVGSGTPSACALSNTYLQPVPGDPISTQLYSYTKTAVGKYTLCSNLEGVTGAATPGCGSCGSGTCYYSVTNP